jgi:hypothetical protein
MASLLQQIGNDISRVLSPSLPDDLGSFEDHLDFILPKIIPYGEDLNESSFWLAKRWQEVRPDEGFQETLLHIFNEDGEYLLSVDGNIIRGGWRQLNDNNSIILEMGGRSELFDLRFLNQDFLVLSKNGDQGRKGQRRYFVLVRAGVARGPSGELDWRQVMEAMYNVWRENSLSLWSWFLFILVIAAMLLWLR